MNQSPSPIPSIDSRYTAATLEKCARIQARQAIQLTYIVISTTMVAALLSGKLEITQLGNYATFVLTVGIPCVAAIFAAWSGNQDSVIAMLDSYCFKLEDYGAAKSGCKDVPRWYDFHNHTFDPSLIGRYWANVAFAVALSGSSLPGTLIIYLIGFKREAILAQILLLACVLVYRYVRVPPSRQPGVTTRYHAVTISFFVVLTAMLLIASHVTGRVRLENNLDYPEHILVSSTLASFFPLAIHIEFERRRMVFLERNRGGGQTSPPPTPTQPS
jgi:hypothetical protein